MILLPLAALLVLLACQIRYAIVLLIDWLVPPVMETPTAARLAEEWPAVTVQLAVYRESRVLRQLLEAVLAMEAPAGTVTIQVLDDSAGEDARRTQAVVAEYSTRHPDLHYLNRGSRHGFKAGALNHGLAAVKSEFVVFFDADCLPTGEFLQRMLPYLVDPTVCAVQARWDFLNGGTTPLTQLQAAIFEWLFRYEISLRIKLGLSSFFMGTAGVWRTESIRSLGGWQEEPFTAEDLDLSYRAAIQGWRVLYHPGVVATMMAVEDVLAFRAQQRRWAHTMLRVGKDRFPALLRVRRCWSARFLELTIAISHGVAPALLICSLATAGAVLVGVERTPLWKATQILFASALIFSPVWLALVLAQRAYHGDWLRRGWLLARALPAFIALGTSFVFGLADFVSERKPEFAATPKGGESGVLRGSRQQWMRKHLGPMAFEFTLSLIVVWAAIQSVSEYPEAVLPLALIGAALLVSFGSTFQAMRRLVHRPPHHVS